MTGRSKSYLSNKQGRAFPLALIVLLFISIITSFHLLKKNHTYNNLKKSINNRLNKLNSFSAQELTEYELKYRKPDQRWGNGWTISNNRYTYTDIDGTKYVYCK